jgi:transaldolase
MSEVGASHRQYRLTSNSKGRYRVNPTAILRNAGQSLWLDNITRDLLDNGALRRYVLDYAVTGLTSNPTIFDHAIKNTNAYDGDILKATALGKSPQDVFFELALADITRAADLFREVYDRTNGVDGWVSLEVPPALAHDARGTLEAAADLHARAARPNVYIKIPGTAEGLVAIEESIFAGIPINVTLLFSPEQYVAAAEAYLRGNQRRIAGGFRPDISSVASVFISRWDVAVEDKVSEELRGRLGIAVAGRVYRAYQHLLVDPRGQAAYNFGVRPQRLLWASTGTKDPKASDTFYVDALVAPFTVNTMPETTLKAYADHGLLGQAMDVDEMRSEELLQEFAVAGIDVADLGSQLQEEGARSFTKSWDELMNVISSKASALKRAG